MPTKTWARHPRRSLESISEVILRSLLDRTAGNIAMVSLTRIGAERFELYAELIRYIESRSDTYVTLTTGARFIVAEGMDEVVARVMEYQRTGLFPPAPRPERPAGDSSPGGG